MKKAIPFISMTDEDEKGWGWTCPNCDHKMIEDDPVIQGQVLVCNECGMEAQDEA